MDSLTIGSSTDLTSIKDLILRSISPDNINSISYKYDNNNIKYIYIKLRDSDLTQFEDVMANWILQNYERRIIKNIIDANFDCFSNDEKQEFLEITQQKMEHIKENYLLGLIKKNLSEHLQTSDKLFVDGFVLFRLKECWNELRSLIEDSVDDYLLKKEYDDFIDLLKQFVDIQEPKAEFIHILTKSDGSYKFYNKFERDISDECTHEFINEVISKEINFDDLLISVLIILSPKKIMWHNIEIVKNKELIHTIKSIFPDVYICEGCSFCKNKNDED